MAYEIINHAQITPMRLYALLRLVSDYPGEDGKKICGLLQPNSISENTDAANGVLDAAVKCGFVITNSNQQYFPSKSLPPDLNIKQYLDLMQQNLLGITEEEKNNFLLNIFAAWYAVLDEKALTYENKGFMAADFNKQIFPDLESRALNDTKLRGMEDWLSFLGFGWNLDRGDNFLIPDATGRIEPLLPKLLPVQEWVPFGKFMKQIADYCPELDNGELYKRCWSAINGQKVHGNKISLMLSTGLRTLQSTGEISLDRVADASDQWTLFEDISSEFNIITHIYLGKK